MQTPAQGLPPIPLTHVPTNLAHAFTVTNPLANPAMSQPTPSPTRLTQDTPLSPTQLSPDTPSSSKFPDHNPSRNHSASQTHRPSQIEESLHEALRQGPMTVSKNPRRLSDRDANLSRRERKRSKAWSGEHQGIAETCGEGEADGDRRRSGPLDAEELKVLVVEKLRRLSRLWSQRP